MKIGLLFWWALLGSSIATAQECAVLGTYDQITAAVTDRFYDKNFRGLDWKQRVGFYRSGLSCKDSDKTLAEQVNKLLGELNVSHTSLYTRDDLEYWALQSIFSRNTTDYPIAFPGVWAEREEDKWYAKYVLPGSSAAKAGVLQGDALIGLNGAAFQPTAFSAKAINKLTVSSDGKKQRVVSLPAAEQSVQMALLTASQDSQKTVVRANKRIGYFHLWSGTHESFLKALNSALGNFEEQQVDALILDIRGGFGGASLDYLTKLKESSYLSTIPKVVLIDNGVRSGKELVAATIKHENMATLVGSRTAAAFMGASPIRFSDDKFLLYLAVANWFPPEIGPIEGIGVEPDIDVKQCLLYCAGRDLQLERAYEIVTAG